MTRQQLAKMYGVSLSTIRRILKALEIQPEQTLSNIHGQPVYCYSQQAVNTIDKYLQQSKKRLKDQATCCICKKKFKISQMMGTRCISCYVQRYTLPLIYGKQVWDKVVNVELVQKAIEKLKSFIPTTKKMSQSA